MSGITPPPQTAQSSGVRQGFDLIFEAKSGVDAAKD